MRSERGPSSGPQEGAGLAVARAAADGGEVEIADGRVEGDDREGRPLVDDLGKRGGQKGRLGSEHRSLQLGGAISQPGPQGVTPATTEYGRSGPRRERVLEPRGRVDGRLLPDSRA